VLRCESGLLVSFVRRHMLEPSASTKRPAEASAWFGRSAISLLLLSPFVVVWWLNADKLPGRELGMGRTEERFRHEVTRLGELPALTNQPFRCEYWGKLLKLSCGIPAGREHDTLAGLQELGWKAAPSDHGLPSLHADLQRDRDNATVRCTPSLSTPVCTLNLLSPR
jgi:hypothetical protein